MSEFQNTAAPSNTIATVAAVLGALSLLGSGCCCVPILNYAAMAIVPMMAILAIVLGFVGLSQAGQMDGEGKGPAIIGVATGFGTFLLMAVLMALGMFAAIGIVALDSM